MTRGFITIAQNSNHGDYVRAAYGLALSLRRTQSVHTGLSVVVSAGQDIPEDYRAVFDAVIELPPENVPDSVWKIHNKWRVYESSPYDETVLLDADMLVPVDIDSWWKLLGRRKMWSCASAYTFRGDLIQQSPFRKAFDMYGLPHVYTAFFYFQKHESVRRYFNTVRVVYQNWIRFRDHYPHLPEHVSGDMAFALAMRLLNIEHDFVDPEWPGIVHMKTQVQDLGPAATDDWTQSVESQVRSDGSISVGGYLQRMPFHYQVKSFLTDEMLERLAHD
jgi:hypothetical protein